MDTQVLARTRTQVLLLVFVVMLSVDAVNPVKALSLSLGVPAHYASYGALLLLLFLLLTHLGDTIYYSSRVFFTSILSIFFSRIQVLGTQNIPVDGPVIFTGNHMNQFVDGLLVMTTCSQRVGFLVAAKSMKRPVIGHFAAALGSIPVARPQDSAEKGQGKLRFVANDHRWLAGAGASAAATAGAGAAGTDDAADDHKATVAVTVRGEGTDFVAQNLRPGDKIKPAGADDGFRVAEVVSEIELLLMDEVPEELVSSADGTSDGTHHDPVDFKIMRKIDQSAVFSAVHLALAQGQSIGIFPEGGSHDRTDLLPLKAGVAAIAFGCLDKYNVSVPIVPVGLNYFRGHRFRGRVVVEYGSPLRISEEMFALYKENRRAAYTALLDQVAQGMRATIVTAPSYDSLQLIYTARRLWQRADVVLAPNQKQDLNRRFAEGYKLLLAKYEGREPPQLKELKDKIENYQNLLSELGLRDYQVPTLRIPFWQVLSTFGHMFFVFLLASIPTIILNAPIGLLASMLAHQEAQKALKNSTVKIHGRDVMLSKKIIISIIGVPVLWISYAVGLLLFTSWSPRAVCLAFLACPLFSYVGVMAAEAGMVDLKDIRPALLRLVPKYRKQAEILPKVRAGLRREIREFIKRYADDFGELVTAENIDWDKHMRRSASLENLNDVVAAAGAGAAEEKQRSSSSFSAASDRTDSRSLSGASARLGAGYSVAAAAVPLGRDAADDRPLPETADIPEEGLRNRRKPSIGGVGVADVNL